MLDQNTDRMWFVIGAVIVGAAIIFIANGTLPELFASVTESFEDTTNKGLSVIEQIGTGARRVGTGNLIRNHDFRDGLSYWVVGPSGKTSDATLEPMQDDVHNNIVKVVSNEPETGMYYRGSDDKSTLQEGNAYRLRALLRADEEVEVGVAFDGSVLNRADTFTIGPEWQWVTVLKETKGTNTRPRVYTTDGGVFYVAEMELLDYIVEDEEES